MYIYYKGAEKVHGRDQARRKGGRFVRNTGGEPELGSDLGLRLWGVWSEWRIGV